MRRKQNWNRIMSVFLAGLMLAQTPASALAAEATDGGGNSSGRDSAGK